MYWTDLPVGVKPQVDMDLMRGFHLLTDERPLSNHNERMNEAFIYCNGH